MKIENLIMAFVLLSSVGACANTVLSYKSFDPAGKALNVEYAGSETLEFLVNATNGDAACDGILSLSYPTGKHTGIQCTLDDSDFEDLDGSDSTHIITCDGSYGATDTVTISMAGSTASCTYAADTTFTVSGNSQYGNGVTAAAVKDAMAGTAAGYSLNFADVGGILLGAGIILGMIAWIVKKGKKV